MPTLMRATVEATVNTAFLLMAQYNGRAVVPLELVRQDFFSHLTHDTFLRKLGSGEIAIPVIRIERSQKAAKGVHLADLAIYIDERRQAAQRELRQLVR